MSFIRVWEEARDSDEAILKALKTLPNGEYCVTVCRNCGIYIVDPNAPEHPKFLNVCRYCFKEE